LVGTYVEPVQADVKRPADGGTAYGAASGTDGTLNTTAIAAAATAAAQAADAVLINNAVLDTATGSPTVALGASTATIDAATWETARNADPGIANVRKDTTYKSKATATKTGTLDIAADNPPLEIFKIGS
jgi:threonine dehydratase